MTYKVAGRRRRRRRPNHDPSCVPPPGGTPTQSRRRRDRASGLPAGRRPAGRRLRMNGPGLGSDSDFGQPAVFPVGESSSKSRVWHSASAAALVSSRQRLRVGRSGFDGMVIPEFGTSKLSSNSLPAGLPVSHQAQPEAGTGPVRVLDPVSPAGRVQAGGGQLQVGQSQAGPLAGANLGGRWSSPAARILRRRALLLSSSFPLATVKFSSPASVLSSRHISSQDADGSSARPAKPIPAILEDYKGGGIERERF